MIREEVEGGERTGGLLGFTWCEEREVCDMGRCVMVPTYLASGQGVSLAPEPTAMAGVAPDRERRMFGPFSTGVWREGLCW